MERTWRWFGKKDKLGQVQGIIATVDSELGIEYKQPGFFD